LLPTCGSSRVVDEHAPSLPEKTVTSVQGQAACVEPDGTVE
jgi:hypothetical protein